MHALRQLLHPLEEASRQLECDGLARVITYLLAQNEIDYRVFAGTLIGGEQSVIHLWTTVECAEGVAVIDFARGRWVTGVTDIPAICLQSALDAELRISYADQ